MLNSHCPEKERDKIIHNIKKGHFYVVHSEFWTKIVSVFHLPHNFVLFSCFTEKIRKIELEENCPRINSRKLA